MKISHFTGVGLFPPRFLPATLVLLLAASASGVFAQGGDSNDALQTRITRARALAAAGNLPSARGELEAVRAAPAADDSVREIALVLLARVYLDQSDYAYADHLLNDTFKARAAGNQESGTRAYFALAGQIINGVRAHLERYRALGLNVADDGLPHEAINDLDGLRTLLERVVTQGKTLRDENARNTDAAALLEDAAGMRQRLARNNAERTQWQREMTDARQRLTTAPTRVSDMSVPTIPAVAASTTGGVSTAAPPPTPPVSATPSGSAATRGQESPANANSNTARSANSAGGDGGNGISSGAPATPPTAGSASDEKTATKRVTPAPDGAPVEVGSLLNRATQTTAPTYPPTARSARVAGTVKVFLRVSEKGTVEAVQHTDGPQLLRRAAEDAARRWKFRPTVINGQPVPVSGFISFNFAL